MEGWIRMKNFKRWYTAIRIEVSVGHDSEIQLTFKCHLWIVSIMPTTYITRNVLKSTRTLWPSIMNSKCRKADTTGRTQAYYWLPLWVVAVMVWFAPSFSPAGVQDWVCSRSFPPPAPALGSWGPLWGWLHLPTYPLTPQPMKQIPNLPFRCTGFSLLVTIKILIREITDHFTLK